jgi:hypothetical protein
VAFIKDPKFDGVITYDADDDGTPISGIGIEIFCSGLRNPFGITLHSNGYLYGTDNGPNLGYGTHHTAHVELCTVDCSSLRLTIRSSFHLIAASPR